MIVGAGDFNQTAPVLPRQAAGDAVAASVRRSPLWQHAIVLRLTQPLRDRDDSEYSEFVDSVGTGQIGTIIGETGCTRRVTLPEPIKVFTDVDDALAWLAPPPNNAASPLSPTFSEHEHAHYWNTRRVLAPRNAAVDGHNRKFADYLPTKLHVYHAFDTIDDDTQAPAAASQIEYHDDHRPIGVPARDLEIREGAIVYRQFKKARLFWKLKFTN